MGYFEGTELQAQLADMVTCNVREFAGLNIRSSAEPLPYLDGVSRVVRIMPRAL